MIVYVKILQIESFRQSSPNSHELFPNRKIKQRRSSELKVIDDDKICIDDGSSMEFSRRESHQIQHEWHQVKYPNKDDEYYKKYSTFFVCSSEKTYIYICFFEYRAVWILSITRCLRNKSKFV